MTPKDRDTLLRTGQRLLREGAELHDVVQRLTKLGQRAVAARVQDAANTLCACGHAALDAWEAGE